MKIYVLTYAEGEYDDYRHVPVGATTDPAKAEAWRDGVVPNHDHDYDELELDDLSEHGVGERIADYLDPLKNPFCECGHKLSQHSTRGKKRCGKDTKGHGLKPGDPKQAHLRGLQAGAVPGAAAARDAGRKGIALAQSQGQKPTQGSLQGPPRTFCRAFPAPSRSRVPDPLSGLPRLRSKIGGSS